jgi:hypothetical protein
MSDIYSGLYNKFFDADQSKLLKQVILIGYKKHELVRKFLNSHKMINIKLKIITLFNNSVFLIFIKIKISGKKRAKINNGLIKKA